MTGRGWGQRPALRRTLLAAILLLGFWLRYEPLRGVPAEAIEVFGDAREYVSMAEFFMNPDLTPPGNRFPGLPFLLVVLFRLLPYPHDAILVGTTTVLSVVVIGLTYVLARRLVGATLALLPTLLTAVHPDLVDSPHRGLSEEPFMVCFLALLLVYLRLRDREAIPWAHGAGLAVLAGWSALVRPDAAYVAVPVFLSLAWQERGARGWVAALLRTAPIAVLPFLLPALAQAWMESLGVQNLGMRVGRAGLWMEFMLGRMPYEYMFYKETSISGWLLGHHSLAQLAGIGLKSTARNALALGEALWGQVAFAVALAGVARYVRRRRDLALPLAIPLSVLLQWALVSLWPEEDVFRYNSRTLPLLLTFFTLGAVAIAQWLCSRAALPATAARLLPLGVAGFALAPALVPFSLYDRLQPALSVLHKERTEYLPKIDQVHPRLAAAWLEFVQGKVSAAATQVEVMALLCEHDAYAPTHFVLGLLSLSQQRLDEGIPHLERALEIVPFFAEAGCFLAEAYALTRREGEAARILAEVERLRPDYPMLALERATLAMMGADFEGARSAFWDYISLNRYQHERAIIRERRVLARNGDEAGAREVSRLLDELDTLDAGLTSPFLWGYLQLDLDGILLPRPEDGEVYYNYGLACALTDRVDEAETHWRDLLGLRADDAPTWVNLGVLYARRGEAQRARETLQEGLSRVPGDAALQAALAHPEQLNYLPARIVLPLTRAALPGPRSAAPP